jgi:hypothetical protein
VGRILELCGEVAAEVEEGADGIMLPPDAWERFKDDYSEEEIEDALSLVRESLLQSELVEAADSLSARLVDLLGSHGKDEGAFVALQERGARFDVETVAQLVRRVNRTEEVLDVFRTDPPPDRRGLESLRERLSNMGIEAEMEDDERAEVREREEDDEDGD